jgi:hypothetical protein
MQILQIHVANSTLTASQERCLATVRKHVKNTELEICYGSADTEFDLLSFVLALRSGLESTLDHGVGAALYEAVLRSTTAEDFGGYGFPLPAKASNSQGSLTEDEENEVLFLCSAYLEAFENEHRARNKPSPLSVRPPGRRAMTMTEKIFTAHDISHRGEVKPGDIIQVDVDWILASELSWMV